MKNVLAWLLVLMLVVGIIPDLGFTTTTVTFTDVDETHWAYDAIMIMSQRGIINGFDDGTFRPNEPITRAEFAKMMVKTLDLPELSKETPSFLDVGKDHWAYIYVESSKTYMVGYRSSDGDRFLPDDNALREDLAVALVKALGHSTVNAPVSVLNTFEDKSSISENLVPHMAIAVDIGLFKGEEIEGKKYLKPQEEISRAEVATLLVRILKDQGVIEKVTYDEEKVTYDNEIVLDLVEVSPSRIKISWTPVDKEMFKYYKVVLSKYDETPTYPEQGSYRVIDDYDETTAVIEAGDKYYNGDFGDKIKTGEYYLAITALLKDGKLVSNTKKVVLVYDDDDDDDDDDNLSRTPKLELARHDGHGIKLEWSKPKREGFKYYKVVLSKKDSSPKYPDNGYTQAISNIDKNYAYVEIGDHYSNSDFGNKIVSGDYYVAITAVYSSGKYTSNVIEVELEGASAKEPEVTTPKLEVVQNESNVVKLSWTPVSSETFVYYKVVLSKNDSTPKYPDDGYMTYISNANETFIEIPIGHKYNGGDLEGEVRAGSYYASITAVFDSGKYTSNVVMINLIE